MSGMVTPGLNGASFDADGWIKTELKKYSTYELQQFYHKKSNIARFRCVNSLASTPSYTGGLTVLFSNFWETTKTLYWGSH